MNTNQKAIDLLEKNEYEESLKLFQKAVEERRGVQSLTNLAWIYIYEEDNDKAALELMKEVVSMNPSSYFPYNLLGEIYIRQENWKSASDILLKSIALHPSIEAYNNLGVAKYHLGDIREASTYFLLGSNNSDYAMYSHVQCLIELGKTTDAKSKLDTFSEDDDEFVGEIEIADLYVELECFEQAIHWFEKGWDDYSKQSDWVNRYIYSLLKANCVTRAHEIKNDVLQQKVEEINDAYNDVCDDDWTESDKKEHIRQILDEKNTYEHIIERISSGYIPLMEFDAQMKTGCYLFGCKRHNHPEYQE